MSKRQKAVVVNSLQMTRVGWDDPQQKGGVEWSTLISSDQTASAELTCGIGFLPVGKQGFLARHRHPPAEIYYIIAGSGKVIIDGATYPVGQGDVVFLPAHCEHEIINSGQQELQFLYVFPTNSFAEIEYQFSAQ